MVAVVIIITVVTGTPPPGKVSGRRHDSFYETVLRPQNLGSHGKRFKQFLCLKKKKE